MGAHVTERARILRMLEEGKVSADEAARLLDALASDLNQPVEGVQRIRITVREPGLSPVHITFPMRLVRTLAHLAAHTSSSGRLDIEQIVRSVAESQGSKLVEIEHGDQRIEVFAE